MKGINEKIKLAKLKKENLMKNYKSEKTLFNLMFQLQHLITKTENERISSGMGEICAHCAIENKPCCGSEIEFKYSPELLTINLLYGVNLPEKPEIPGMCHFLTNKGCCLFARDVFCINFICDKIKNKLSINKLKKLRELEGLTLDLQFKIEKILKNY